MSIYSRSTQSILDSWSPLSLVAMAIVASGEMARLLFHEPIPTRHAIDTIGSFSTSLTRSIDSRYRCPLISRLLKSSECKVARLMIIPRAWDVEAQKQAPGLPESHLGIRGRGTARGWSPRKSGCCAPFHSRLQPGCKPRRLSRETRLWKRSSLTSALRWACAGRKRLMKGPRQG